MITRLIELLWRLVLLPFKLVLALGGATFRLGARVGAAPVRVGWRLTRRAGWMATFCFFFGLAVGLLLAPTSGSALRARLREVLLGGRPADPELAERVAFELAHAPRTWHLDQPQVDVIDGEVVLRGTVAHEIARGDLAQAAAAVPGVTGVRDELDVAEAPEG